MKKYYKGIINSGEVYLLFKSIIFGFLGLFVFGVSIYLMISSGKVKLTEVIMGVIAVYAGFYAYPRYLYYTCTYSDDQVSIDHWPDGKIEFICEKYSYIIDSKEIDNTIQLPIKDSNGRIVPTSIRDKIMYFVEVTKKSGEIRKEDNFSKKISIKDSKDIEFQPVDKAQKRKYFKYKYNFAKDTLIIPIFTILIGAAIGSVNFIDGVNGYVFTKEKMIHYSFVLLISLMAGFIPYVILKIIENALISSGVKKNLERAKCTIAKKYKKTIQTEDTLLDIFPHTYRFDYLAKVGNLDKSITYNDEIKIKEKTYLKTKIYDECFLIKISSGKDVKYDVVGIDVLD